MKRKRGVSLLLCGGLSFLLALGGAGCLITAFDLNLESFGAVVLTWAGAAVICAGAWSYRWGGGALALLAAAAVGFLWRQGSLPQQLWQLVYRISAVYNRAYHWGVFKLVDTPWDAGTADLPVALLGIGIIALAAWSVRRGKPVLPAVILGLLPLAACVVVTDTVPAEGYLFALLFAVVLLLLTGQIRSRDGYQADRLTLLAAVPVALALSLLFFLIPKQGYVDHSQALRQRLQDWLQKPKMQTVYQNPAYLPPVREPEGVELSSLGPRRESRQPVMYVDTEVGGALYLRGRDYDQYDGTRWISTTNRVEQLGYAGVDMGTVAIQTLRVLDQVYLPYYPAGGQSLISGALENTRLTANYTFRRQGLPDDWYARTAEYSRIYTPEAHNTALPEDTRAGAEEILSQLGLTGSVTDRAMAIGAYVQSSARYDRNTQPMPGAGDFALWFLEESDRGYCVHFATAAAVLLRAAGIEARYVSGYMVRTPSGGTAEVTGEHAHAWAEYYEPALDTWLVLEATPADPDRADSLLPVQTQQTAPPTVPQTTPQASAGEEMTVATQPQTVPIITETAPAPQIQAPPQGSPWLKAAGKWLLWLGLGIGVLEGQVSARKALRRLRRNRGGPNARALARWREAAHLAKLRREAPLWELEALANRAKFSQHTLTAREIAVFDSYLRSAKGKLAQKSWYWRLIYRYVYAIL